MFVALWKAGLFLWFVCNNSICILESPGYRICQKGNENTMWCSWNRGITIEVDSRGFKYVCFKVHIVGYVKWILFRLLQKSVKNNNPHWN